MRLTQRGLLFLLRTANEWLRTALLNANKPLLHKDFCPFVILVGLSVAKPLLAPLVLPILLLVLLWSNLYAEDIWVCIFENNEKCLKFERRMPMKFINQRRYSYIPYPQCMDQPDDPYGKNGTVRSGGCGLCSTCMVIDQLTTKEFSVRECTELSIATGANHGDGTDMHILGPVVAENLTWILRKQMILTRL